MAYSNGSLKYGNGHVNGKINGNINGKMNGQPARRKALRSQSRGYFATITSIAAR